MAARKAKPNTPPKAAWSPSPESTLREVLSQDNDAIIAVMSVMALRVLSRSRGQRPSPQMQAALLVKSVCEAVYAINSSDVNEAGEYSKRLGAALMILHGVEKSTEDEKGGKTRTVYTGMLVAIVHEVIQFHAGQEAASALECTRDIAMFTGREPNIDVVGEALRTPKKRGKPGKGRRGYFEVLAEVVHTMGIELVHDAFILRAPLRRKDVDAFKEARDEARDVAQTMVADLEKARPALLVNIRMVLEGTPDPALNLPLDLQEYLIGAKFWPEPK